MTLEKGGFTEQQLPVCLAEKAELTEQKNILLETLQLKEDQNLILKNMIEMQKKTDELKDKLHADQLKAAKPTFFENLKKIGIGIGIGVVIAIGAILAL